MVSSKDLKNAYEIGIACASNSKDITGIEKLGKQIGWPATREECEIEAETWTAWYLRDKVTEEIVCRVTTADQTAFIGVGNACTHPGYLRRGLFKFLFSEVIRKENAREEQNRRPFILSSTPVAIPVYNKLGFHQVATTTNFTLAPNESIEQVDLKAVAQRLSVTARLINDMEKDLIGISSLSQDATRANFKDYYKGFLSAKKGQDHRRPCVYVIEKDGS